MGKRKERLKVAKPYNNRKSREMPDFSKQDAERPVNSVFNDFLKSARQYIRLVTTNQAQEHEKKKYDWLTPYLRESIAPDSNPAKTQKRLGNSADGDDDGEEAEKDRKRYGNNEDEDEPSDENDGAHYDGRDAIDKKLAQTEEDYVGTDLKSEGMDNQDEEDLLKFLKGTNLEARTFLFHSLTQKGFKPKSLDITRIADLSGQFSVKLYGKYKPLSKSKNSQRYRKSDKSPSRSA